MKLQSTGKVIEVKDGVAFINGLSDVGANEFIEIEAKSGEKVKAIALNLEEDQVSAVIAGDYTVISQGDKAYATSEIPAIKVNKNYLGRVVNALGEPIDGLGEIDSKDSKTMILDKVAPGVVARKDVERPLQTGITAIDAMIPVGRGQRELIIGDRQTGKTTVAIDALINQKDKNCFGIYVSIGQKTSKLAQIINTLKENDALQNTVIVSASASDPASMQYLAAFTGTAIGEYFAENGMDSVVVYDDLTKHAQAYRQVSLLLRRPSGREAYPGDIFYLHSKILERAVEYSDVNGGGSMTALPIIETQAGDVSAYIPTNVISITDGQIFLETDLFNSGFMPAISVGTSVSRVGGAAQTKGIKSVAGQMKLDLAQYRELAVFAQFGSDLDASTKLRLSRGERAMEVLKQKQNSPRSVSEMIALVFAATKGLLDVLETTEVSAWANQFVKELKDFAEIGQLDGKVKIENELAESLSQFIAGSVENFNKLKDIN